MRIGKQNVSTCGQVCVQAGEIEGKQVIVHEGKRVCELEGRCVGKQGECAGKQGECAGMQATE
jgi:hypothetical protein